MIGPIGFAVRSIRRRGFHTLLAIFGLSVTIASTTYLSLLNTSFTLGLGDELSAKSTLGISWLLQGYLLLTLIFVLAIGLVSVTHLVSSMVSQRERDIGVIETAGYTTQRLSAYAVTEALLVSSTGSLTGGIIGVLLSVSWSGGTAFGGLQVFILAFVPLLSFLLSYGVARYQVSQLIGQSSMSVISSGLSTLDMKRVGKPILVRKLGSAFNVVARTVLRNRHFGRTVLRISVCIFLATIVLTGSLVSWSTSKNFVERAMPPSVFAVGTAQMVSQYNQLGESFSESGTVPAFDYLNASNLMSPSIADAFRMVPGAEKVDGRLITVTTVDGYFMPESFQGQITLPAYQGSTKALFVGIDPNQSVGNWYSSDGLLTSSDPQNLVMVGDSLVNTIVQEPFSESDIVALGATFQVKGGVVDPVNRGNIVYAQVNTVQQLLHLSSYNLILVKTDGIESTFQSVQQIAATAGLAVGLQDPILQSNIAFLDGLWSRILVFPILTFVLTALIVLSHVSTSYSGKFNDYVALRVLGARPSYTARLLLWEGMGLIAICLFFGLLSGLIFCVFLLVPAPVLRIQDLATSSLAMLSALSLVVLASALVYWRRLGHTTVKDLA